MAIDGQQLQFTLPHRSLPAFVFTRRQQTTFARAPPQIV
jgi:hypothetical protein